MERKLTAILSADVKGYSRLMGEDEEATVRTLTAYRQAMASLIQQHRGRVVDSPGDNVLAEFASVVDAVRCAVEIQRALKEKNAGLPEARRMEFRMGINVGDVVVEGERLYGDGVNIAARLEGLAEAGGLCISGTVHDHLKNKLSLEYDDLGEQVVKNIADPVRVYRVLGELRAEVALQAGLGQSPGPAKKVRSRSLQRAALAVAVVLLLGAGGMAIRGLYGRLFPAVAPSSRRVPAPALADKPSIAVLPFTNMSGDPEQEYFSDGITEDLITDLATVPSLLVIARNSTFVYKGKPVNIAQISRELGARYVVEGSVQRAGGRVRITAQLIDAASGGHLWAGRYDRELKDLFAVQDEITQRILGELRMKLLEVEERLGRRYTSNLEAWDYFMRGLKYTERSSKEGFAQARQMWEKALALDPRFALAYGSLAKSYGVSWVNQWSRDPQTVERAFALAQKAVALDDSLAGAHAVLGMVYRMKRQYDRAIAEGERGVALSSSNDFALMELANTLLFVGRPQEAIGLVEKAMRLNPYYPPAWLTALGGAYRLTGRNEEAIAVYKKALARNPDLLEAHRVLAVIYSESGRMEEARAEVAEILRISPQFTLEGYRKSSPLKDRARVERNIDLLRKAGLK